MLTSFPSLKAMVWFLKQEKSNVIWKECYFFSWKKTLMKKGTKNDIEWDTWWCESADLSFNRVVKSIMFLGETCLQSNKKHKTSKKISECQEVKTRKQKKMSREEQILQQQNRQEKHVSSFIFLHRPKQTADSWSETNYWVKWEKNSHWILRRQGLEAKKERMKGWKIEIRSTQEHEWLLIYERKRNEALLLWHIPSSYTVS